LAHARGERLSGRHGRRLSEGGVRDISRHAEIRATLADNWQSRRSQPNSVTQSGVYYDIFTLPTRGQAGGVASGTEAYYSFEDANIHFVCLDSEDSPRATDGAMAQWLKAGRVEGVTY